MGRQTYYLLLIQGKEFLKTSMILYLNVLPNEMILCEGQD